LLGLCCVTKTLSPCVAEIIQAWNEFPVQEHQLADILGPPEQDGGTCLPQGKEFLSTSPRWNYPPGRAPKLLEIRPPPDHQGHNRRHKWRIVLARQNLLLQEMHRCTGTAINEQARGPHFYS
jgi:hypothetical protein